MPPCRRPPSSQARSVLAPSEPAVAKPSLVSPARVSSHNLPLLALRAIRRPRCRQVFYITGGTSGLGEQVAKSAAAQGAKVCITGRRAERGAKVVAEIAAAGGEAMYVKCDVMDAAQVKSSVDAVVEKWGRLDLAFNNGAPVACRITGPSLPRRAPATNLPVRCHACFESSRSSARVTSHLRLSFFCPAAGVAPDGDAQPPHMVPVEAWNQAIGVNVNGVSYCLKYELAAMLKLQEADPSLTFSIVNCASIYSVRATVSLLLLILH